MTPATRAALFLLALLAGLDLRTRDGEPPQPTPATTPASTRPTTTAPARDPNAVDGLYLGLRTNMVSGRVDFNYLALFPDGRVFNTMPDEGMAVAPDAARERNYGPVGKYERRDDDRTVRVRWESGELVTFDRTAEGHLVQRGNKRIYRPLAPLDGLTLNGTYEAPGFGADAAASITFTPDGRFTERGLMSYTSWAMLGDPEQREKRAVPRGSGRYTIGRNTLELTYDDGGPVARFGVFLPVNAEVVPTAETLYINASRFARAP